MDTVLGVMSRFAAPLHAFFLSIPLKVMLGILVMTAGLWLMISEYLSFQWALVSDFPF